MKTAALILSALFFTSISGAASAHGLGESDIRNLAEAYGYVPGSVSGSRSRGAETL